MTVEFSSRVTKMVNVLGHVTSCSLKIIIKVSEKRPASFFRVEDWGRNFRRSFHIFLHLCMVSYFKWN